jgi:hypothetical protein
MASSYSTDLKLELMVTGENAGTWGDKTNSNLNLLQQAIAGYQAISIAGGAQTTALVMSNAEISTARNAVVKLTGTITGNQIVTIPNGIEKTYIIENGTSGAFTVQFKTASGTGPTFSTTDKGIKIVYSDGTNVVDVNANLSGPTLASDLDVNGKSIISTSNGNIVLAPNGTGDVQLDADTVRIGDSNANATLTTNGTGDLILNTNSGSNSGSITINEGTNGDIEITPNGTGVVKIDGLSYPTADGSVDQVLKTNGSGVISFGTISSSPTSLKSSIPLKTAASVTAGKLASINSSGEIVNLPTLNTYGTAQANSSTVAYSGVSTNGSRVLKVTTAVTNTYTFTGVAISNSGTPTNGGTTVAENIGTTPGSTLFFPVDTDKFIVCCFVPIGACEQDSPGNFNGCRNRWFLVTVDASGNCTKGTTINNDFQSGSGTGNCGSLNFFRTGQYGRNIVTYWINTTSGTRNGSIYWSGSGTTLVNTSDADAQQLTEAGTGIQPSLANSLLTSGDVMCTGRNNSWLTASWNVSTKAIGTVTSTTVAGDYLSSGQFFRMANFSDNGSNYVLFFYVNTSGVSRYVTYSINQSTGALTQVQTGAVSLTTLGSTSFSDMIFKDETSNVVLTSGGFITQSWSSGAIQGFNNAGYNTNGSFLRYNGTDLYYFFNTNLTNFPTNQGYQVNAYSTETFNYAGVTETTTSTSPASIITDGVAAGFTSLTPGTIYYAATPLSGEVSTSSASNLLIGKAISSTQILLQRSNTQ